jgi:predicted methyltransferase
MPAHHTKTPLLGVANARRSPSHGCALRLDQVRFDALLGHDRRTLRLRAFTARQLAERPAAQWLGRLHETVNTAGSHLLTLKGTRTMNPNRRVLGVTLALLALGSRAQAGDDARLRVAIDGPHRSAANRARDPARHPYETLRFFGLQAGHVVIEASPGGGWYTEILAPYLRDSGRLYAAGEAADDPDDYRRRSRRNFDEKLAKNPELYDRVVVGTLPRGPRFTDIAPVGGADLVLTFRNVHNWIEAGHLDDTLRAFAAVLKPGGVLGVEEHRAPPGSTLEWIKKNGYVTEALLIERARAAGLELADKSELNANPRDTQDHPNGVWSLPPTLRGGETDRAKYIAIGESDRFTHRYVKRA